MGTVDSFPTNGANEHPGQVHHVHPDRLAPERVLHGALEMNLALGAGGHQKVASGLARLLQPFYLQGLAVRIAPGPGAVAAADG